MIFRINKLLVILGLALMPFAADADEDYVNFTDVGNFLTNFEAANPEYARDEVVTFQPDAIIIATDHDEAAEDVVIRSWKGKKPTVSIGDVTIQFETPGTDHSVFKKPRVKIFYFDGVDSRLVLNEEIKEAEEEVQEKIAKARRREDTESPYYQLITAANYLRNINDFSSHNNGWSGGFSREETLALTVTVDGIEIAMEFKYSGIGAAAGGYGSSSFNTYLNKLTVTDYVTLEFNQRATSLTDLSTGTYTSSDRRNEIRETRAARANDADADAEDGD